MQIWLVIIIKGFNHSSWSYKKNYKFNMKQYMIDKRANEVSNSDKKQNVCDFMKWIIGMAAR